MAEASLEGIPASISPIAVASRTGSVTPLVDAMELWENGNKALQDLLTTKASIHPQTDGHLGTGYGTSLEQVPISWIYQRSQSHLLLGDPRCHDHLLSSGQGSQDNPRPYHQRSQIYLLLSHQRCWGQKGLQGWDTPKRTWQHHVGSGGANHLRGE